MTDPQSLALRNRTAAATIAATLATPGRIVADAWTRTMLREVERLLVENAAHLEPVARPGVKSSLAWPAWLARVAP